MMAVVQGEETIHPQILNDHIQIKSRDVRRIIGDPFDKCLWCGKVAHK